MHYHQDQPGRIFKPRNPRKSIKSLLTQHLTVSFIQFW